MSVAFNSSPDELIFKPGTLGAFLKDGESGWPEAFTTWMHGATIRVSRSQLRHECQSCTCRGRDAVTFVRIALDMTVERPKCAPKTLHVEDLYPAHILDVLDMDMDEGAITRIHHAIQETLMALDPSDPVAHLLDNCIAPMRLYEPMLNALVNPGMTDTMAQWIGQHLGELLCDGSGHLLKLETPAGQVCINASNLDMKFGLRSHCEVKLVGDITLADKDTGETRNRWRCRGTLMKPTTTWNRLPTPNACRRQRIDEVVTQWREELADNVMIQIQKSKAPWRLSDILPQISLEERILESHHKN